MSPAAVDHGGNSTNNSRRNSLGYSPRDKFSDPKSPKSPDCASSLLQKNLLRFPQTFSPLISFRTTTICGGVVVDNNNLNLHHTPPKRTRPSSLYSPPPTTNTTTPKFFKPEFVRNFNSSEWFGCNDQNSRDSGFESAASTSSSSHRSTPVDQTDTDVITNGGVESSSAAILSSVKRQCRWDDCPNPDLDEGDELLEHILSAHVQPLESSTESCRSSSKNNTNLEKYSCRWKDCKVYCKPSRLYAWLERHVVEKHAGPRPYGCPVPGCRQRFNGRSAAERHINSHFENSADDETAAAATATSVPVMTVNARTTTTTTRRNNNKNLHETKRKTTPIKTTDDKIYDVQKCCLLSPRKSFNTTTTTTTTSTVNGGKKKNCINIIPISSSSARLSNDDVVGEPENAACATKILASTVTSSTTTVNKKRCHASSKSSLPADALDDKFVRNALAWHLSLSMTNERLVSSTTTTSISPCRKRNSGINHQQHHKRSHRCGGANDADETTFQCKVLARRRRSADGEFEFLVDWSPTGYLPSVWMPKNMYKSSFTVANSFVSRLSNANNNNINNTV